MSPLLVWTTIALMGLLTYALRLSFIIAWERIALPDLLREALRYVPPAVLAAIILPELLRPGGALDLSPANPRLLAGIAAMIIAWRTRNALLTIGLGMAIFYLVGWLVGK